MELWNKMFKFKALNLNNVNSAISFLIFFFEICRLNVLLCTEIFLNKI
jgi:hypothetical protein